MPADFDHTFQALSARTLSDLTTDERHVLRSASLLDAWDLDLATQAAGFTHQSAARRLIERPVISEDPHAIWPYHLHGAIRTALRAGDDHTEDQWTAADWHHAAMRALTALGQQWQDAGTVVPGRTLLVACLRLARDHRLDELAWLTDAAYAYTGDSVWEPVAHPPSRPCPAPHASPGWTRPPTLWPSFLPPSPAASTSTANAPPSASPPSWTPVCCPASSPNSPCPPASTTSDTDRGETAPYKAPSGFGGGRQVRRTAIDVRLDARGVRRVVHLPEQELLRVVLDRVPPVDLHPQQVVQPHPDRVRVVPVPPHPRPLRGRRPVQ